MMRKWPFARWETGTGLLRQFAVLSLIVIVLITTALSFVISYYLKKDLQEREWASTADYVRTEASYHLAQSDFSAPTSHAAQERFRIFYEQTVMMPEIVRVKIYDAEVAVVWSDEPRLAGSASPTTRTSPPPSEDGRWSTSGPARRRKKDAEESPAPERHGCETAVAGCGEDGVQVTGESGPDVAAVDVRLPGMDGLDVLRRLREVSPATAVVMMTAYTSAVSTVQAMRLGAFDYMTKPLDLDELRVMVEKAAASRLLKYPQAAQKGPDARRRPRATREAYSAWRPEPEARRADTEIRASVSEPR